MIRIFFFIAFIACVSITVSSCIKDRIQPTVVIVTPPPVDTTVTDTTVTDTSSGSFQVVDYWNFNSNDTTQMLIANPIFGRTSITYQGNYHDAVNPGSTLNARNGDSAGNGLRMRNPFVSVTFTMPTTGYTKPVFTFAVQRSSNGPTINNIYYSIDGTNFISDSLSQTSVSIDTVWALHSIDFSGITRANNNPNFAIRLVTGDNNTGTSGNDRYDNVTLEAHKK